MPVTVDYYITLNSPFTYLGCALLAEIAQRNNATVNIKPGKFGPIFEQTGGLRQSCKGMMPLNCPWNSGARFGNGRSLSPTRQRSHRPQSELVSTPQSYVRTARWTPNSTTYMISIRKKR